ncbi:MAG TPA: TonB family protein [Terriglobales bacterium]|nr:TonB family protein [Terriglobales bacterium]
MATTASPTATDQFLPDFSSQFLSDLQGLLEKAGRFTGATSAAIAFVEAEELVTKVSMGECAPDPGSRSPISGSFTGLCVQQHDVQRCDDASKDDRVDSAACQALGIASMVIVPISEKRQVLGVLAAFSPKPNAFSPTHVALLRTIADIVIELRKRYPADPHPAGFGATVDAQPAKSVAPVSSPLVHSAPDVTAPEPKTAVTKAPENKAPVSAALPTFASTAPVPAKPEPAAFEVAKPEPTTSQAVELHATMASIPVAPEPKKSEGAEVPKPGIPKQEEIRIVEAKPAAEKKTLGPVLVKADAKLKVEHSVELWKREPLVMNNVEEADEYARLIQEEPKKEAEILSTAADIGFAPVIREDEAEAQPMFGYGYNAPASRKKRSVPVAKIMAAVVALAVFAAAATWFFKRNSPVAQPQAVQAAEPHVQPMAAEPQPASAQVTPDPVSTPAATGPTVAMVLRKTDLKLPAGKKETKIRDSELVPDRTIILNGGTVPKRIDTSDPVAPPKVTADGSSGVTNILSMVKPTQPQAAFQSSSIGAPVLIRQVAPQFPAFARQMHIKGDQVILNGTVEKNGSVSNIKVIRGKQVFVEPAVNAVKEWKYKPAMLNGEPTPSTVEIVVNFVDR